jgi:fructokinase
MILCAGEALIDMLPRRTAEGEDAFAPHAGGAVFNTAVALGRLDAEAGYFGGLSTDILGELLVARLADSRVDTHLSIRSHRPTTLAFVRLVDGQARYAFYDEGTAGRMLHPDTLPALPDDVTTLFFGGISLISEPCGTAYEALMTREAAARVTMIDPNVRTSFISDEAAYRARIERMIGKADIVKVSDEDLEWLYGPGHVSDRAGEVLALGPKLVFITEGRAGARGYTADHEVRLHAEEVAVVDTVGAGDTFNAGILAELQRAGLLSKAELACLTKGAIEAALSLAIRAAAVTVSRAGANPPWSHEI